MRRPLLFAGVGFFPYARFPGRLKGWRDLLASSTVSVSSLVRCLALLSVSGRLFPPLFGVLIHRTTSSTMAALRPPEGLWPQERGRALVARRRPLWTILVAL